MAERLTLTEAAEFCGVHRNTVRGWVKAGRLDTARLEAGRAEGSRVWKVDAEELREQGLVRSSHRRASGTDSPEIRELVEALRDAEQRAAQAEARLEELEELRAELHAARREADELRRLVVRMELETSPQPGRK